MINSKEILIKKFIRTNQESGIESHHKINLIATTIRNKQSLTIREKIFLYTNNSLNRDFYTTLILTIKIYT